jgi:hypothetical protein
MPAAIDAVKQWTYKPYLLNQTPVEVETTVLLEFVIERIPPYVFFKTSVLFVRSSPSYYK